MNEQKATTPHLQESDQIAYDEANERVPVVWPGSPETPEQMLVSELSALGATIPDVPGAIAAIDIAFDRIGDKRAAETLAMIFTRLPGGRRGAELKAALLGAVDGETSAATARRFGVSRMNWGRAIERLRRRITQKRSTPAL